MELRNNENNKDKRYAMAQRNKANIITFVTVVIIVILVGVAGYVFYSPHEDVYIGRAEVNDIRISGKVPGRISKFRVEEGQMVHAGDTLVEIYSPEVYAKELQAKAADKAAEAIKEGVNGGVNINIQNVAEQAWIAAKAAREAGEKTYERAQRLYKSGVISAQKHDEAQALIQSLRAAEDAAKSQVDLAKKGLFSQDKAAAQALVDKSAGVMAEVAAYLKEAALVSPIDGKVSDIFPHQGELVGTGAPIMTISDMTSMHVIFSIREDKLVHLKEGAVVKARIPALDDQEVSLRVQKMKDMGTYAVWKATKPTGDVDLRTFEVTMIPEMIPDGLQPGMTFVLLPKQL